MGRFRNLIQTTVVPAKRARYESNQIGIPTTTSPMNVASQHHTHQLYQQSDFKQQIQLSHGNATPSSPNSLYQGLPAAMHDGYNIGAKLNSSTNDFDITPIAMGTKLGLLLPNPAPDVTPTINDPNIPTSTIAQKVAYANANSMIYCRFICTKISKIYFCTCSATL